MMPCRAGVSPLLFFFSSAVRNDNFSAVPNIFTNRGLKKIKVEVGEEKKGENVCY